MADAQETAAGNAVSEISGMNWANLSDRRQQRQRSRKRQADSDVQCIAFEFEIIDGWTQGGVWVSPPSADAKLLSISQYLQFANNMQYRVFESFLLA